MAGLLQVVGTPIGNLGDLSPRAAEALAGADVVACEDTRRTRKLLSAKAIPVRELVSLHAHNERERASALVSRLVAGERVALVSDAGMPSVSDPGQALVTAAVEAGVAVEVVPGPSAVLAALVLSGLATDRFAFDGFLARKGRARRGQLASVAAEARTVVLFESPHRLAALLADLRDACGASRRVAVARELTKLHEEVWRGTVEEAAQHFAGDPPKGEVVVVVEGAPAAEPPTGDAVEAALVDLLGDGVDRKTAIATVAADLGVAKRDVYAIAVRLASGDGADA